MSRSAYALLIMLVLPVFAGCLGGDEPTSASDTPVAQSAEEAGATTGEAPSAPTEAYAVPADAVAPGAEAIAYPVPVETNPARAPVTVDFSGTFEPGDCRGLNFGPMEEVLVAASDHRRWLDLSDTLQVGDVFAYSITLSYVNSASNWAEIHPGYGIGSTIQQHDEPTQEMTDVVINWTGQGYRASADEPAWLFVGCFVGLMSQPIPYTYTATFTFADSAVPAESPMLLSVPEDATRLFVRGVAIDGAQGVLSHFRLFAPDDSLLCECALSSSQEVASIELPEGGGDFVLLVDHTSNGFVSAAFDVPASAPMRALTTEWIDEIIFTAEGGPVDETFELDLPRVPLFMNAWVRQSQAIGMGQATEVEIRNARGVPLFVRWGGHLAWADPVGGQAWLGLPGEWAWEQDHHAYAPGAHTVTVKADELRGEIILVTRQYAR